MGLILEHLDIALRIAAVFQFVIAGLGLFLSDMLGWRNELERLPHLMREVFHVHTWFISLTLVIFGVLTWRFADEFVADLGVARWLAAAIGIFWAVRVGVQLLYYSPSHYRGRRRESSVHITLLAVYSVMAATYIVAAI